MKTTIKDVARQACCSPSLVSFYLNHPQTTRVAETTKARIDRAIRALDYRPNLLASILKNGSGRVIGIMIDTEAPALLKRILSRLEREIVARGFYLQVGMFHDNSESLRSSYTLLKQFGAQGVICLSHDYPELNEEIGAFFAEDSDTVFYDRPERGEHSLLELDLSSSIAQLREHLKQRGKTRLALCLKEGIRQSAGIQRRIACYNYIFQGEGLPLCSLDPALSLRENFARTLLPYLKEEKPDAVLFSDDEAALGAMQFLHSVGLKIPRDLSIIGFDDDPQGRNATPSLTTIAPDIPLLAEKLTELLLEQLEHQNPPRRLIFPSRLILRESCC